jgi:hypothetical protein
MVTRAELQRRAAAATRDVHQMLNAPSRARSVASRIYPNLTDDATRARVKANWQAERNKPSRRFKRKPFRRRGEEE